MRPPLLASFLLFFLLTACAAPPAVPPTATLTPMPPTATLESSPTATQPAPTEIVPTQELLPADVLDVLKGQEYAMADTDGDGVDDRIVAANGDTLFQYVDPEDRVNPEDKWQRMETFTLTTGEKIEMPRFDTAKEAYDYMLINGILWKPSWGTMDLADTQEKIDFYGNIIFKIPEVDRIVRSGEFLNNNDGTSKTHIMLYSAGDRTVVVFLNDQDILQVVYVDAPVNVVRSGLH